MDGGHEVRHGIAWPIERDTPIETPESAARKGTACILFAIAILLCAGFAALTVPF
jgi:hypothetical protein